MMIFYQVFRRGRRYDPHPLGRLKYEGDNKERANRIFEKEYWKLHSGAVYLLADGAVERHYHGGFNRTRW